VFTFNPSTFENGSHAVDATAYDLVGMRTTASIDLEVSRWDTTPPTLTRVYPSDGLVGVNVSVDMFVAFSEAMDVSSTESAISLETGGSWVASSKTWQDESSLTISPATSLEYAADYTLHINASAMDVAGNMLQGGLEFTFRTQSRDGVQTVSGVVMAGSTPVSGAVVTDGYGTVLTDEYGSFVFPNVPSGSYSFSASKWNYSSSELVKITLGKGQVISGLQFKLSKAPGVSTITGVVFSGSSNTLEGALVSIKATGKVAFTDENGRFILSDVVPGRYSLKVSKLFYTTKTIGNVDVAFEENSRIVSMNLSSNSKSRSTSDISSGTLIIGDVTIPIAVGAGVLALAGGMVVRRSWRSDRKEASRKERVLRDISGQNGDGATLEELDITPTVNRNAAANSDFKALDSLVDLVASNEPIQKKRVVSILDPKGDEDFVRGLKELEKLR
jgi:hypothetical protein